MPSRPDGLWVGSIDEVEMSNKSKEEEKFARDLDLQLDRELEDTFPASDALKITRRKHDRSAHDLPSQ
jgi:hypothetical protein